MLFKFIKEIKITNENIDDLDFFNFLLELFYTNFSFYFFNR